MMSVTRKKILGGVVFVVCLCVLQSFSTLLEYDRQQILSGEIWRILTGHLVHSNITHLMLNAVAALIIYFAFFPRVKTGELLTVGFSFSVLISVALLFIYPGLDWYNGLSGLLHALVVYFSARKIKDGDRIFWVALGMVWLKVLTETTHTDLGYGNLMGGMTVITEAHLIGAFVGTISAIIWDDLLIKTGQPGRKRIVVPN